MSLKNKSIILIFSLLVICLMVVAGCNKENNAIGSDSYPTPAPTPVINENVALGTLSDNVYTNEYAGFNIEFDSDWTVTLKGDASLIPELTKDVVLDANGASTETFLQTIHDLHATRKDGATIDISYNRSDISVVQRSYMKELAYVDTMVSAINLDPASHTFIGLNDVIAKKAMITIFDETSHYITKLSAARVEADQRINVCGLETYFYASVKCPVTITVTASGETEAANILKMVSKI